MANWVSTSIAIKGSIENVLAFINEGLKNSYVKTEKDIRTAFNSLLENGGSFARLSVPNKPAMPIFRKGVTLRTFMPMPYTFLVYDTTNKDFPIARQHQLANYGVVGWYDYNIQTLGCKWDCELENLDEEESLSVWEDIDEALIRFDLQSPWSPVEPWCKSIKDKFNVNVFILAKEESNMFNYYKEIDGEEIDCNADVEELWNEYSNKQFDNDEEQDAVYLDVCEKENELKEDMDIMFSDYVFEYEEE